MKLCLGGGSDKKPRTAAVVTIQPQINVRAHVVLLPKICEMHGHTPSIKMHATQCAGGCAIYKLQQNWCIRRSCTATATCEARAAIKTFDHLKTLSIILLTHRKKSVPPEMPPADDAILNIIGQALLVHREIWKRSSDFDFSCPLVTVLLSSRS
ncbi:hypothetical protein EVAR_60794_1 [Eumeta japonica]|uniref:Uncharacterized protein n=1 Tax=Eumeta variegata TaxID=151549 RepID=A0A4C1ZYB1_EUMVA|nr:hypothetical protein EVAR_60794_1 [Eumeta japonica]